MSNIEDVKILNGGVYVINKTIKMSDLTMEEDNQISFEMQYNDKEYTEEEAHEICESFILEALHNAVNTDK